MLLQNFVVVNTVGDIIPAGPGPEAPGGGRRPPPWGPEAPAGPGPEATGGAEIRLIKTLIQLLIGYQFKRSLLIFCTKTSFNIIISQKITVI